MGSIPLSTLPLSVCPWQKTSHHIAHSGWATVKLGIDLGEVFSKGPEQAKLFLHWTRTGDIGQPLSMKRWVRSRSPPFL